MQLSYLVSRGKDALIGGVLNGEHQEDDEAVVLEGLTKRV